MIGYVVYGRRNFGMTDAVPGVFYVETNCYHINYFPLCPNKTFLILGPNQGVQIPTSGKSILVAYLRFFSVIGITVPLFIGLLTVTDRDPFFFDPAFFGTFFFFCGMAFIAFRQLKYASYERAIELCSHLGAFEALYRLKIDRHFNRLDGVVLAEATVLENDDDQDEESGFRDEVEKDDTIKRDEDNDEIEIV